MITNFLKSGLSLDSIPIISSMQTNNQSSKPVTAPALQIDKVVEATLSALEQILSEKLGQKIEKDQFRQLSVDILKSQSLEASLVETKQKYNDLVNKSTLLYQQARKIGGSVGQFINSINIFIESEELLVPLG